MNRQNIPFRGAVNVFVGGFSMPKKVATKVATLTKNVATLEYNKLQQFAIAISKNPYISMGSGIHALA